MTGNGGITLNFAPIDLKPRIWTFQMGYYRSPLWLKLKRKISGAIFFLFFLDFDRIFLPYTPFFDLNSKLSTNFFTTYLKQ